MQYNIGDKVRVRGDSKTGWVSSSENYGDKQIYTVFYEDGSWTTEASNKLIGLGLAEQVLANGEVLVDRVFEEAFFDGEFYPDVRNLVIKYNSMMYYICMVGDYIDWIEVLG